MAMGVFLGLTFLVCNLYVLVDPDASEIGELLKWWFSVFSGVWLLVLLPLLRMLERDTATWAINVGAAAYFGGMHAQTSIPFEDDAWRWVVYNLFVVVPLVLYGLASTRILALVLGAGGLVVDVYRLTVYLTSLADDGTAQMLIRFFTLGVSGILVVWGGIVYQTQQGAIAAHLHRLTGGFLGHTPQEEPKPAEADGEGALPKLPPGPEMAPAALQVAVTTEAKGMI